MTNNNDKKGSSWRYSQFPHRPVSYYTSLLEHDDPNPERYGKPGYRKKLDWPDLVAAGLAVKTPDGYHRITGELSLIHI